MAKTAKLNIRIDPAVKGEAEELFRNFGITLSDAINIFLHQSVMVGGLPFDMKVARFNSETEAAMQEAILIGNGTVAAKAYSSARALFEELDTEC